MARNSGEQVNNSDWTDMASAFNTEVKNRRGRNYTVTSRSVGYQINAGDSINPLINGLKAVTNGRQVNSNGSLSGSTYNTSTGSGTIIYPLATHRTVISRLAAISKQAAQAYCGCYSGCVGLCSGCSGTCSGNCDGSCQGTCNNTCQGCSGCTGCSGSCSGECQGCSAECRSSCKGGCHGCESSAASAGCSYCQCANYPS